MLRAHHCCICCVRFQRHMNTLPGLAGGRVGGVGTHTPPAATPTTAAQADSPSGGSFTSASSFHCPPSHNQHVLKQSRSQRGAPGQRSGAGVAHTAAAAASSSARDGHVRSGAHAYRKSWGAAFGTRRVTAAVDFKSLRESNL